MRKVAWALVATALTAAGFGCGPPHVQAFTPRQRLYKPGDYAQLGPSGKPTNGSLFSDATPGFLEDTRAVRVGDFVMINVNENANAQGNATTNLNRNSSGSIGMPSLFGIIPALQRAYPDINPSQLIAFTSQAAFAGTGTTTRSGQLTGSIAVRVVKEMPNGDLYVEGTKVVLINNEEYHLYLSGLVRRADIAQDDSVDSTRLADAQIEFTGRGDLADQNRKGWLARLLDTLNPF